MSYVPDGNQICMCLDCGFHDSVSDPVACPKRDANNHTDPCGECTQGFELFKDLRDFHTEVDKSLEQIYSFDYLLKLYFKLKCSYIAKNILTFGIKT